MLPQYKILGILTIAGLFLLIPLDFSSSCLLASGGYGGAGIQQDKGRIDREKYQLGKSIYNGEFPIPAQIDETKKSEQYEQLNQIQNKLPRPEQRRTNLLSLAGRLTEEQLEALRHFVSVRFNVRFSEKD